MNKIIIVSLIAMVTINCQRKPFVEHKLKFEKVSDDCSQQQSYFRMVSNFGGERYEFEKCLPADFRSDQLSTARQGDTVVINFPKMAEGQTKAAFHITLDIDSYPSYSFVTIDGDTYIIAPTQK
jgi:hypothetical protein